MTRNAVLSAVVAMLALAVPVSGAKADATFHTERIPLASVGGAPLHSGFVVDIHANGPIVYAHEIYQLNGAQPDTAYHVQLLVFPNGTSCTGAPIVTIPEATLQTNGTGNGTAEKFFTPQDVGPFRHHTFQLEWQLLGPAGLTYQTSCIVVALD